MKTIVYFLFSCFISTGAFIAALGAKYPLILYGVGFGIWALFLWGWNRRTKRDAVRRNGERMFQDYMRGQLRNLKR